MWMMYGGAVAKNSKSPNCAEYIPFVPFPIASSSSSEGVGGEPQTWLRQTSQWPASSESRGNEKGQNGMLSARRTSEDDVLLSPRSVICTCAECQGKAHRISDPLILQRDAHRRASFTNKQSLPNNHQTALAARPDLTLCEEERQYTSCPQTIFDDNGHNPTKYSQSSDLAPVLCLSRTFLSVLPDHLFVKSYQWDEKTSDRSRSYLKASNPLAQHHEITFHSRDWTDKNFTFLIPLSAFTAPK